MLRSLDGFLGATVMRRPLGDEVEFVVMTRWASLAAIDRFAGADSETAVVDHAANAVLSGFDTRAEHFELALEA